jgi:hypothetical protein
VQGAHQKQQIEDAEDDGEKRRSLEGDQGGDDSSPEDGEDRRADGNAWVPGGREDNLGSSLTPGHRYA